jgi:hypothetical protein
MPIVYKGFSDGELAALEAAAETDDEVDGPPSEVEMAQTTPEESMGDSSDSSDDDILRRPGRAPPLPTLRTSVKRKAAALLTPDEREALEMEAEAIARWRDAESVPEHVPAHLPPLPGFERDDTLAEDGAPVKAEAGPSQAKARASATVIRSAQSWRTALSFDESQLAKEDNGIFVPSLPVRTESPPPTAEEPSSLTAFYKLHRDYKLGKESIGTLQPTGKRRRLAKLTATHHLANHDSLYASTAVEPYRESSRTAGWVPYAFDVLGRNSCYLRDFDGPLINSVSHPATDVGETFAPPAGRAPGPLAHVARQLAQQDPLLAARLTRIAPPGPLDVNGQTIPYLLDDAGAVAAVRLPAHQEPLYFMPGWSWRTRDPMTDELPHPVAQASALPIDVDAEAPLVPKVEEGVESAMDVDATAPSTAAHLTTDDSSRFSPPRVSPPPRPDGMAMSPSIETPTGLGSSGFKLKLNFSGAGASPSVSMAPQLMAHRAASPSLAYAPPVPYRVGSPSIVASGDGVPPRARSPSIAAPSFAVASGLASRAGSPAMSGRGQSPAGVASRAMSPGTNGTASGGMSSATTGAASRNLSPAVSVVNGGDGEDLRAHSATPPIVSLPTPVAPTPTTSFKLKLSFGGVRKSPAPPASAT